MSAEPHASPRVRKRRPRADAVRNRQRLLNAAVDVIVERGPDAPLEDIARRAEVGIATLYRHFPDRNALVRQVAIDLLTRSANEAKIALTSEPDAFRALARYMHRAVDLRISAIMPVLNQRLAPDEELTRVRQTSMHLLSKLVTAAQLAGSLRTDVTSGDIGLLIIRLTRPFPGTFPSDVKLSLAHRHLDLVLDGLRSPANGTLHGPLLTVDELAAMGAREARERMKA